MGIKKEDDIHKYDDIIHLPHHQSGNRRHMTMSERAAQFAPFAPLTGHMKRADESVQSVGAACEDGEYGAPAPEDAWWMNEDMSRVQDLGEGI